VSKTGLKISGLLCALVLAQVAPAMPQGAAPINVGLVYSKTGPLASYGAQYAEGFAAGLDYATHGTGAVAGHKIVVTERDDTGAPDKAVAAAKELIGQGYKIIAGTVVSGIALQMAPLAKDNNILYISGPAAADAITGANRNTFRSGRQTYQDVRTAGTIVGSNLKGKHVTVFAQDTAFGKANFDAVTAVLGGEGADVSSIYVPPSANDFVPFAQKLKDAKADMVFVAWAGATAPAMWKAVDDAGVPSASQVVTGLDQRSSYPNFGSVTSKITFLSYYFYQAPKNKVNDALVAALKKQGKVPDLFDPDGFVAAQMIVHAIESANGDDVGKMISALEGWTFDAPKGRETVRAADHAMLQPMFVAKLSGSGTSLEPQLVKTLPANDVAPPVKAFK
jgi:branched-chain amino acid transport system substrate-binding protein